MFGNVFKPPANKSGKLFSVSLTYIGSINLCVLCVFVVRSTPSLGEMYLRIHFTHQSWEGLISNQLTENLSR
ncbi:MAG: hypothetical protein EWV61_01150 [Microcystis aeruginosa Ma_AC_P_19900807_S300]|nr:MAG: hypothetical protein EWV61_01150 [Microcystis aeruginosa Ma_AC_P_19900807_S300]